MKAIIFICILLIICVILYVLSVVRKNKKFKKSPIGWMVKYWMGSEDYVGRVISASKYYVVIKTHLGEKSFGIEDVVPLHP